MRCELRDCANASQHAPHRWEWDDGAMWCDGRDWPPDVGPYVMSDQRRAEIRRLIVAPDEDVFDLREATTRCQAAAAIYDLLSERDEHDSPFKEPPLQEIDGPLTDRTFLVAWVGWLPLAFLCGAALGFMVGIAVGVFAA